MGVRPLVFGERVLDMYLVLIIRHDGHCGRRTFMKVKAGFTVLALFEVVNLTMEGFVRAVESGV